MPLSHKVKVQQNGIDSMLHKALNYFDNVYHTIPPYTEDPYNIKDQSLSKMQVIDTQQFLKNGELNAPRTPGWFGFMATRMRQEPHQLWLIQSTVLPCFQVLNAKNSFFPNNSAQLSAQEHVFLFFKI